MAHHERSQRWYFMGAIVVLSSAAFGIVSGNWSFSIVVVLIGAIYFLLRNAPPLLGTITLNEHGVQFGNEFTSWADCVSFWLIKTPNYTELHIARKGSVFREIVLQTGTVDTDLLRATLATCLQEHSTKKERLVDMLIRICKL